MESIKTTSGITFIFEGDGEVQALSVARVIEGLVNLTNIASAHIAPDADVKLSIKAISPGSLQLDFVAIAAAAAQTVLTSSNIATASAIASLISHGFKFKRFLLGRAPKSVDLNHDNAVVENVKGDKIIVPKGATLYFREQKIDSAVSLIINNAATSPGVTGISVLGEGIVETIPREEFETCGNIITFTAENVKTHTFIRRNEILFVRQPDIMGATPWTFRNDKNMYAEIADTDFMARVHAGEIAFSAGSFIVADVAVTMEMGKDGLPIDKTSKYSVIKVIQVGNPGDLRQTSIE